MVTARGELLVVRMNQRVYIMEDPSMLHISTKEGEKDNFTIPFKLVALIESSVSNVMKKIITKEKFDSVVKVGLERFGYIVEYDEASEAVTITNPNNCKVVVSPYLLKLVIKRLSKKGIRRYYFTEPVLPLPEELWRATKEANEQIQIKENLSILGELQLSLILATNMRKRVPGGQIYLLSSGDGRNIKFIKSLGINNVKQLYIYVVGNKVLLPQYSPDLQLLDGFITSECPIVGFVHSYNITLELTEAPISL